MNQLSPLRPRPTTNAAEGLPRWRWTLDDIERLVTAGVFGEFDRLELIGGELVPMSPRGNHHEYLRNLLSVRLARMTDPDVLLGFEPQFNLADDEFRKPDIMVYPKDIRVHDVRGDTVLLAIEVSDSSYGNDTLTKAATYARFGVRDYWVIKAESRQTEIFRDPDPATGRYTSRISVPETQQLQALLVPGISLNLASID